MGEYHVPKNGGPRIKLGVCDDWRYVRRDEAARMAPEDAGPSRDSESTNIEQALQDPNTVFRFPWPWEDEEQDWPVEQANLAIADRDMFTARQVRLPWGVVRRIEHHAVWVPIKGATTMGSTPTVRVKLPCPQIKDFDKLVLDCQDLPEMAVARIIGERYGGARGHRTVFECPYCAAIFSLGGSDEGEIKLDPLDEILRSRLRFTQAREEATHGVGAQG